MRTRRGRKSLDMTISRLRKLLECEDGVVVNEGRVELSSMHVWTDITPFLRAFADVSAARDDHTSGRLEQPNSRRWHESGARSL